MKLTTHVEVPASLPRMQQGQRLVMMGSCFATAMGQRLQQAKFDVELNPYGVLYNPASISAALRRLSEGRLYGEEELFFHAGCWHSPMHHSDFSATTVEEALQHINARMRQAAEAISHMDVLLVTWGTAWVYRNLSDGKVVGNCHKLPERMFERTRLDIGEVVDDYTQLLEQLFHARPRLQVIFTVSPIRHLRDGLHDNQLSKATLLLAIDRLCRLFPRQVSYFPAYELLMDELRDYRFYAADMAHPSEVAEAYVWECFSQHCLTPEALQLMHSCEEIGKALAHKPLHPESDEYKRFLEQIVLKIERLTEKYPYLDFKNERETCHTLLKA